MSRNTLFIRRMAALMITCGIAGGSACASVTNALPVRLSLEQCQTLARAHNPSLQIEEQRVAEQSGRTMETEAIRRPVVDVDALYQYEEEDRLENFGGLGSVNSEAWSAGVEVTQPLFKGGQLTSSVRASQDDLRAVEVRRQTVLQEVLLQVSLFYYRALLADERIEVQEESVRILGLQLDRARQRYEAGAGPRFDVLQAEVAVANARPPLIRSRSDYRIAVDELRRVIGLPYASGREAGDVELADGWPLDREVPEIHAAVATAMANRPELMALVHELEAAAYRLQAAKRERWPGVNAFGGYGMRNDRFSENEDVLYGWTIGVAAELPIWEGGAIRGRVDQRTARYEQLRLEEKRQRLDVELEVRKAWFAVEEAREILTTADRVIEQAGEALRLAESRYRVGGSTQLDVLQAELGQTRARLEKVVAAHDYHAAYAKLQRALGLLQ